MDYFELRYEERADWPKWLQEHRGEFLCKVYDRISYAVDNELLKVKLFIITVGGEKMIKCNLRMESLKEGGYLEILLEHFEDIEDYERCKRVLELRRIIHENY